MPSKTRINKILDILKISDNDYYFLGSYNNPDFEYFGDVDVNQNIILDDSIPYKLKDLLNRIKKYGSELGFKLLELKFGMDRKKYFRSERLEDYIQRWNKEFKTLEEAREFTKNQYKNRIFDVDASMEEIKRKFKRPNLIKLDVLVYDTPNFTIEIMYTFKDQPLNLVNEFIEDIEKQKRKGKWGKVAKRLYSIAKHLDDREKMLKIADLLKPYLKYLFYYYSLDIEQPKKWIEYVKNKNININEVEGKIKNDLINNLII